MPPDEHARMGARAREHVLKAFSLEQMKQQTLQVYDALLGTKLAEPTLTARLARLLRRLALARGRSSPRRVVAPVGDRLLDHDLAVARQRNAALCTAGVQYLVSMPRFSWRLASFFSAMSRCSSSSDAQLSANGPPK